MRGKTDGLKSPDVGMRMHQKSVRRDGFSESGSEAGVGVVCDKSCRALFSVYRSTHDFLGRPAILTDETVEPLNRFGSARIC